MREAGGTFLSRGMSVYAFEGGTLGRTTLIEFPSADAAAAAYTSPGYQAALEALGDAAEPGDPHHRGSPGRLRTANR